jgi:hypothetical protein
MENYRSYLPPILRTTDYPTRYVTINADGSGGWKWAWVTHNEKCAYKVNINIRLPAEKYKDVPHSSRKEAGLNDYNAFNIFFPDVMQTATSLKLDTDYSLHDGCWQGDFFLSLTFKGSKNKLAKFLEDSYGNVNRYKKLFESRSYNYDLNYVNLRITGFGTDSENGLVKKLCPYAIRADVQCDEKSFRDLASYIGTMASGPWLADSYRRIFLFSAKDDAVLAKVLMA